MEKVRTFIAIRLLEKTRHRLGKVGKKLLASGVDVKWVPEGNFHITLKFLGDVESDRIKEIAASVESAIEGIARFDVSMRGVGAFPRISRPSVIWVGIDSGGEELKLLAERVESALEQLGFTREDRPFSPHITIGRVKSPKGLEKLRAAIEDMCGENVDSFTVHSVAVMKSDLRPSGPIYTAVAEFELE